MEEQQIKGIKFRYLREKENADGSNHFFELLDSEPLTKIMELKDEDMILPFWGYNEKFYLKLSDTKLIEYQGNKLLQENMLYVMDLTFKPYDFKKEDKRVVGITINKINKNF